MSLYRIRSFDKTALASSFACGQTALDDYIRRYAAQDARRNVARVFLATPADDPQRLAGFFTLSAGSIACAELPDSLARKLPRYPVPVALIGRLAVATEFQGKGLGSILLADACQKVAHASAILAMAGIVVSAKNPAAEAFYTHFGFAPLPGASGRLWLAAKAYAD